MSDRPEPSPALLAANEKLLAQRAEYQARKAQRPAPQDGDRPHPPLPRAQARQAAQSDQDVLSRDAQADAQPPVVQVDPPTTTGGRGETAVPAGAAGDAGMVAGASPPWEEADATDGADTAAAAAALPVVLAALPDHLGWGSTAVADHIRGHVRERPLSMANPAAGSGQVDQRSILRQAQDRFGNGVDGNGRGGRGAAGGGGGGVSDTAVSDGGGASVHAAGCPGGGDGAAETAVSPTPQASSTNQPSQKLISQPPGDNTQKIQSSISLHPDLALALLRAELVTPARLWLLLRRLDGDGRGWLAKTAVQAALTEKDSTTYLCTPRYLRQLLARGEGTFWQQGDDGRLWLRGQAKVARALGLGRLRGRMVELPVEILLAPIGDVRAHFYAAFHSGRGDEAAPVSRETLRDLSGASARTQQAYEARAGVASEPCVALGPAVASVDPQAAAWRYGRAGFTFVDHQGRHGAAGRAYYARRLPNRYRGPHARGKKPRRLNRQLAGLCLIGDAGNGRVDWNGRRRYWPDGAGATRAWLKACGETAVYWPGRGSSDGVVVWLERPSLTV